MSVKLASIGDFKSMGDWALPWLQVANRSSRCPHWAGPSFVPSYSQCGKGAGVGVASCAFDTATNKTGMTNNRSTQTDTLDRSLYMRKALLNEIEMTFLAYRKAGLFADSEKGEHTGSPLRC